MVLQGNSFLLVDEDLFADGEGVEEGGGDGGGLGGGGEGSVEGVEVGAGWGLESEVGGW